MGWGGREEGGSGWGTHVNPWLIHVNVWQNPLEYCKVISLQLIKINGKKINIKKRKEGRRKEIPLSLINLGHSFLIYKVEMIILLRLVREKEVGFCICKLQC